jgi:RNA polymerase sigma factor (sigma-70 family)
LNKKGVRELEDREILRMYFERDHDAIAETSKKYGNYCRTIAMGILGNEEDAEECINDMYLNAWNSIPPHCPERLAAYLGKIIRNLSFNRYKKQRAKKRAGAETALALEELEECVPGRQNVEQEIDRMELVRALNEFLEELPDLKREIFICRYWYVMPVREIAVRFHKTESNISAILSRVRSRLRMYLDERGYVL